MRKFILMALAALGLTLAAPAMSTAAPAIGGISLQALADEMSPAQEVRRRWYRRRYVVRRYWAPRRYYARRYYAPRRYIVRRYRW